MYRNYIESENFSHEGKKTEMAVIKINIKYTSTYYEDIELF
jgi:hypothetical protein